MRQYNIPTLAQKMAYRLLGTKPLSEPMRPYCQLDPKEHNSVKVRKFSFTELPLKMSSAKWQPFCLGLNMLRYTTPAARWRWLCMWQIQELVLERIPLLRNYYVTIVPLALKPSSGTHMRHWIRPSLVHVMAVCPFGAKPLPEPVMFSWTPGNRFQRYSNHIKQSKEIN